MVHRSMGDSEHAQMPDISKTLNFYQGQQVAGEEAPVKRLLGLFKGQDLTTWQICVFYLFNLYLSRYER